MISIPQLWNAISLDGEVPTRWDPVPTASDNELDLSARKNFIEDHVDSIALHLAARMMTSAIVCDVYRSCLR